MLSKKLIYIIILLALGLRAWGINFGLPDKHIIDEQGIVYSAFHSAGNNLRPHPYLHAPLFQYILLVEYVFCYVILRVLGIFKAPIDFPVSYFKDSTIFFLIGRMTSVIFGVATVFLIWKLGKRFFGPTVGLIASFLLATNFLHAKESHYIKEDIVMTLLVLASFYFCLKILKRGKTSDYLLCGVFLGLALSAKLIGILIVPIIILAHFVSGKEKRFKNLIYTGIASLLTYCLVNPYLVIDPRETLGWIFSDFSYNKISYSQYLGGRPMWQWFALIHIPEGVGRLVFLSSFLGFIICFVYGRKAKEFLLVPIMPLIFLLTVDKWTQYHSARFALITIPFFVLGSAILIGKTSRRFKKGKLRNICLLGLLVLFSFQSATRIIKFNKLISSPDTRGLGKTWIEKNIDPESRVLVEGTLKPEIPANLNVSLNLNNTSIEKRIKESEELKLDAVYLKTLKKADVVPGFNIVATPRVNVYYNVITNEQKELGDASKLFLDGIDYVILSNWAVKTETSDQFHNSIEKYYVKVIEFHPTYEFPNDPHFIDLDYKILDKVTVFRQGIVFGPVIEIYKSKNAKK